MKLKPLIAAFLLTTLPSISFAVQKREIIIGFGGGYSIALDRTLREYEYDYPLLIYFKEKGKLEHSLSADIQYYFTPMWGLQLEFTQQKGRYFSHLEWYGQDMGDYIYPINHIEEPYWERWTLSSLTLSALIAWKRSSNQKIFPYASLGGGIYVFSADNERVMYRWRLGGKKWREKIKIGAGLKYRLNKRLGLNLRIFAETILRRSVGYGNVLYIGPHQFDFESYLYMKEVYRVGRVLVKTFSYGGFDIRLEFKL
jgi:hypothetical protein